MSEWARLGGSKKNTEHVACVTGEDEVIHELN